MKTVPLQQESFARQYEDTALIDAPPEAVFAFVAAPARLSSHMTKPSWMMGGGRMDVTLDEGQGRKVGAHIRVSGKAFGIALYLDEVVTIYEPPHRKAWETVGDIRLLVIGHYRMTVGATPQEGRTLLRVRIEYDLPTSNAWLGRLFGGMYATWCVQRMLKDARAHLHPSP